MGNPGKNTIVDILSDYILNSRYQDLEPSVVENTKKRILDVFGDIIGAVHATGNDSMVRIIEGWGGNEEATIIGYGLKAPLPHTTMANCILCRSYDWEPLVVIVANEIYPSHTTCTTAPTAISVGEYKSVSGKELITALVVGDDISARLTGANIHPWNLNSQNRVSFTTNRPDRASGSLGPVTTFGATAIASRSLGLTPKQINNAFGIALEGSGEGGSGIWDGATTFKFFQGASARNAITAVQLAKGEWFGGIDPLFGERGSFFGPSGCDRPEILTEDLGKKHYVELVFKPYPGGRPTHTAIQAALKLTNKNDVNIEDVDEILLHLSTPAKYGHYMRPYKFGEDPTADALFSYKFSTASALYRKAAISKYYSEQYIRDPKLQNLIGKVKLADWDQPEGVRLEVKMKNGQTLSEEVRASIDFVPDQPSWDTIVEKFFNQVEFSKTISEASGKKIVSLVEHLEDVDNITRIIDLAVQRG